MIFSAYFRISVPTCLRISVRCKSCPHRWDLGNEYSSSAGCDYVGLEKAGLLDCYQKCGSVAGSGSGPASFDAIRRLTVTGSLDVGSFTSHCAGY